MLIELFGPPGSGKSTLAESFQNRGYTVIKIHTRAELLWYNLVFCLSHPVKALVLLSYIVENSGNVDRFYTKFTNGFLHANAKYQKAKKSEKAVIDQGHFQNAITIFEKELRLNDISKFIKILPQPDILLVIDIPRDLRSERARNRGYLHSKSFFEKYDTLDKIEAWEAIVDKNFERAKEVICSAGLVCYFLGGSSDIEEFLKNKMTK